MAFRRLRPQCPVPPCVGRPVRPEAVAPAGSPTSAQQRQHDPLGARLCGRWQPGVPGSSNEQTASCGRRPLSAAIEVRHQCGRGNREAVAASYAGPGVGAEVSDRLGDMAGCLCLG